MIAQEFTYTAPATLQEALALHRRRRAQDPRRRHEPDPADEAAPRLAGRGRRPRPRARPRAASRNPAASCASAP